MSSMAAEMLANLRARGVLLTYEYSTVRIDAPCGVLSPEERQSIMENRSHIFTALRRERLIQDPRSDLVVDSHLWQRLLTLAYDLDGTDPDGLWGALHGLRCLGAELRIEDGCCVLRPGEIDGDEYQALRSKYLVPHADALTQLLGSLSDDKEVSIGEAQT